MGAIFVRVGHDERRISGLIARSLNYTRIVHVTVLPVQKRVRIPLLLLLLLLLLEQEVSRVQLRHTIVGEKEDRIVVAAVGLHGDFARMDAGECLLQQVKVEHDRRVLDEVVELAL